MVRGHRWPGHGSCDPIRLLQTLVRTVVLLAWVYGSLDQRADACAVQPDALGHVHVTSNSDVTANSFNNCSELASVTISNAVTDIGDFAFFGCTQLFAVTLPDSLRTIGRLAFFECPLTTINIPSGAQIGLGAFESGLCGNLYSSGQSLCNCGTCSPTATPTSLLQPNAVPTITPTARPSTRPTSVAPSLQPSSPQPTSMAPTLTPTASSPATSAPSDLPTAGVGLQISSPTALPSLAPRGSTTLPPESTSPAGLTPVQTQVPTAQPTHLRTQPRPPPASQSDSSDSTVTIVSISVASCGLITTIVYAFLLLARRRSKLSNEQESVSNENFEHVADFLRNADTAEETGREVLDRMMECMPESPKLTCFDVQNRIGRRTNQVHQKYDGCNASVYKALVKGSGGVVALKVIFNIYETQTDELSRMYAADFSITETLPGNHPNIVRSLGHFTDTASKETLGASWDGDDDIVREHTLFVVLECLDVSLKQLMESRLLKAHRGPAAKNGTPWPPMLSVPEFLLILQRLLRAICHLIHWDIVHRDIKPDNILLAGDGLETPDTPRPKSPTHGSKVRVVKLADFDQALDTREYQGTLKMPFISTGTSRGGAPAYLAPEVMSAPLGTDTHMVYIDYSKNDVFAAGMVAYDMLTSGTGTAFITSPDHPNRDSTTYSALPIECPKEFSDLVWAMINPDFTERITAAEALAIVDLMGQCESEWVCG
eukprot:m.66009 g.66009  ORF g.66009 m.66009 type:complete len:715 (+) comp9794_c0_seq3:890-3034(+)